MIEPVRTILTPGPSDTMPEGMNVALCTFLCAQRHFHDNRVADAQRLDVRGGEPGAEAGEGRTDGLRAQVRQVADAGPLDRLEQWLDPDDERADAEGGGRPLYQVGTAHAQCGPSPPAAAADQRVLGDHGEVGPGNQDENHGERQEFRVLRPRHGPHATWSRVDPDSKLEARFS